MEKIKDLIKLPIAASKATCEKQEWVGKLADGVNSTPGNLRPINYPRMAKMISHLSIQDCHYLYKKCEESKNFAATFRWSLKVINS